MIENFYRNKTVLVTGHTGFKGSWLCHWLIEMGAKVHGFALKPTGDPNLFSVLDLERRMASSVYDDICCREKLFKVLQVHQPEIVIHMAAQPLVRASVNNPLQTFYTNVIGTVNILDAVLQSDCVSSFLNVTSDKCYHIGDYGHPFTESDALGGNDPYSASKACAEIVTAAYRHTYSTSCRIATARAGNVIGGGDWSADRIIPDCIRAAQHKQTLKIRCPEAIRPWQHVLEPLYAYLLLSEKLYTYGDIYSGAWNFGPLPESFQTVSTVVKMLKTDFGLNLTMRFEPSQIKETQCLTLNSEKACSKLGWTPTWQLSRCIQATVNWYNSYYRGENMIDISSEQIRTFMSQKQ